MDPWGYEKIGSGEGEERMRGRRDGFSWKTGARVVVAIESSIRSLIHSDIVRVIGNVHS